MLHFIFIEHFFQVFLSIILIATFVVQFISNGIITKYPEMIMDGLGLFNILRYPFKNKVKKANEILDKTTEKIEVLNDKLNEKVSLFNRKTFYPVQFYLACNILAGYLIYTLGKLGEIAVLNDGTVLINTLLLIVSMVVTKRILNERS